MYNKLAFSEVDESIVNDAQELLDGNFAVIDQRFVVELLLIDDSIPVLSIAKLDGHELTDPTAFSTHDYKEMPKRYFTGEEISDSATEAYYSMIRHRNVDDFLGMFTS